MTTDTQAWNLGRYAREVYSCTSTRTTVNRTVAVLYVGTTFLRKQPGVGVLQKFRTREADVVEGIKFASVLVGRMHQESVPIIESVRTCICASKSTGGAGDRWYYYYC